MIRLQAKQLLISLSDHRSGFADTVIGPIDFELPLGTRLGITGPSGSGKSSLAKAIFGLLPNGALSGSLRWNDDILSFDIVGASAKTLKALRTKSQLVWQNSATAFNPRWTIARSLAEAFQLSENSDKKSFEGLKKNLMSRLQVEESFEERLPSELSGGQLARMGLVRALACQPKFLVADEITSQVDRLLAKEIIDFLVEHFEKNPITGIFISHDLELLSKLCSEIIVIEDGKVIEGASVRNWLTAPQSRFSRRLFSTFSNND